jgi:predicted choloylglycine hydrolase
MPVTRRAFLRGSVAGLGALAGGCASATRPVGPPATASPPATARLTPATPSTFPLLEVRGSPREIGHAVGRSFAAPIRRALDARGAWFRELKAYVRSRPASLYASYLAAARKHAPRAWEELRGLADGARLPLDDLAILHLQCEYEALRAQEHKDAPGCSSLALRHGERAVICHNEDNHVAYAEMALLRLRPEGGPSALCAAYPGFLPGGAPWINDRGLAMTTNTIVTKEVRVGVGIWFLAREAVHARSLDAAVALCRHPQRSYAFHHLIASAPQRRIVSLETTPSRHALREVAGLLVHTNHLLHPSLAGEPQDEAYVRSSSMSRYRVLSRWREGLADPRRVTREAMVRALSSHEGRPYSPCRHPQGEVRGATLLTAVIDVSRGAATMRVCRGQPCRGVFRDYAP